MLDTLLKLLDELFSYKKYRTQNRKDGFTNIYDPIYSDLSNIRADYTAMFRDVLDILNNPKILSSKKLNETTALIQKKRRKNEPIRDKLKAFVWNQNFEGISDEEQEYLKAIKEYFSLTTGDETAPYASVATNYLASIHHLQAIEGFETYENTARRGAWIAEGPIGQFRKFWSHVSEKYLHLKMSIWK
ncbi:hypothetical protein ACQ86N_42280 [Puia sp. P3]|uniref:hypothetical protein n=1 Tax=Puia sp. P3 TaxID=3423952 RepID=UPI003D66CF66